MPYYVNGKYRSHLCMPRKTLSDTVMCPSHCVLVTAYPSTVRYVNRTITTSTKVLSPTEDANPAPGK
jgi:hypothetical protein